MATVHRQGTGSVFRGNKRRTTPQNIRQPLKQLVQLQLREILELCKLTHSQASNDADERDFFRKLVHELQRQSRASRLQSTPALLAILPYRLPDQNGDLFSRDLPREWIYIELIMRFNSIIHHAVAGWPGNAQQNIASL